MLLGTGGIQCSIFFYNADLINGAFYNTVESPINITNNVGNKL